MGNRRLSEDELTVAGKLLGSIRRRLKSLSGKDSTLLWALRRKVYKELSYDERTKPLERRRLKAFKRAAQRGRCAVCKKPLPEKYAVLDRIEAMLGYTRENTRLIHQDCDVDVQRSRRYE